MHVYTVVYWNEREAQWKPTGSGVMASISQARRKLNRYSEECLHQVSFRIVQEPLAV